MLAAVNLNTMIIYQVAQYNSDGRAVCGYEYFTQKEDAVNFYKAQHQFRGTPCKIRVWETKEYSDDLALKEQALKKLTEEERQVLGI